MIDFIQGTELKVNTETKTFDMIEINNHMIEINIKDPFKKDIYFCNIWLITNQILAR